MRVKIKTTYESNILDYIDVLKEFNFRQLPKQEDDYSCKNEIEIESLEDLNRLQEKLKNPLVLENGIIEIYDDYRE